jgi:2-polyprenyl-6-methoxyphenol hydroxylase-like FAD-dependent oxidoreductase
VPFRIVDAAAGPGLHSRAMVVQARTLEFYRQFEFADEMIGDGIVIREVHLREAGRDGRPHEVVRLKFDDLGAGISPYPFALTFPQDDHERFLHAKLADAGATVEWNTALDGFTQGDPGVEATLQGPNGTQRASFDYVCGCDGAHSNVRRTLGLGFPGATYEQLFFVCDARFSTGFDPSLNANLGEHLLLLSFPVRSSGMQRLIGLLPPDVTDPDNATFETIRSKVEPVLGTTVSEVNWFAVYRVHHRVAERFRVGRAFILGDAAHIHSPAGGQGMNTGIGDAMNLGWKLADVVRGRARETLLDTFEEERIRFARALVATTDRAFTAMVAPGWRGMLTRRFLAPLAITVATSIPEARHAVFRVVSQTHIDYPESSLSEGSAGKIRGGDRLPWIGSVDNYAPLRSLDWQVHCFGEPGADLRSASERLGVALHAFAWSNDAARAGFAENACYLVRPDGYVALAADRDAADRLIDYVMRGRPAATA